jgi:hypothetical protein
MDEQVAAMLEILVDHYLADERKHWEEMGRPGKHIYWALKGAERYVAEQKRRWEEVGVTRRFVIRNDKNGEEAGEAFCVKGGPLESLFTDTKALGKDFSISPEEDIKD